MRPASILGCLAPALLSLVPALVQARVGEVLFVYGSARVESPSRAATELHKGSELDEGDHVSTGSNGRLQIQMDDGGLIVLRPLSELVIEQFHYPAAGGNESAATQTPRSLMSLVRGGFRAITGTLGKANPEAYEMRTPVATIGIRGTDYSALYCGTDCSDLALDPGLYVGVTEGAIAVTNAAGSLTLSKGQFGFVQDEHSAPVTSSASDSALARSNQAARDASGAVGNAPVAAVPLSAAQDTSAIETPAAPEVPVVADDGSDGGLDLTTGALGGVAVTYSGALGAGFSAVTPSGTSGASADSDANLVAFSGATPEGSGLIEHHGGITADAGRDTDRAGATGLRWGRWSGGTVVTTGSDTSQTRSLARDSLHWIAPGGGPQPVLPSTGHAEFELIGNTSPTDDAGRAGTLGSASLAADFTAQTVDASLSLSFAQTGQVWDASARALPIDAPQATFGGAFDSVTVHTKDSIHDAAGSLSGFFTGSADGTLAGAGMSYGLSDGVANVAGTAAFQRVQPGD